MKIIAPTVAMMEKKITSSRLLVKLYSKFYTDVVQNEIKLAGITSADRVLNIGCGGIPFTALLIAKFTGARVWAIDNDQDAVDVARKCINTQNMDSLISVLNFDGRNLFPYEFDVALVALQAEPKKDILESLAAKGGEAARLVFRSPRSEVAHQYDRLPCHPSFNDRIDQKQATFDCSVLYANL